MCKQSVDLLQAWIVELLRGRASCPARELLARLEPQGVCPDHFQEGLRALLVEGRVQLAGSAPPDALGKTPSLLDLPVRASADSQSAVDFPENPPPGDRAADLRLIRPDPTAAATNHPGPASVFSSPAEPDAPGKMSQFPAWSDSAADAPDAGSPGSVASPSEFVVLGVESRERTRVPDDPLRKPSSRMVRPAEVEEAARDPKNTFGHFIFIKEVGKGGMGTVYRAWDNSVGRIVALKVLRDTSREAVERFVLEARIAGRLTHPAIALIYEVGEHQGHFFIAMQFIDGKPLGFRPQPVPRVLELIRDAARTLQYAHDQGIIHRDVKPGNLLVDSQGKLFLTDFGLAKEVTGALGSNLSVTGHLVGTPVYMSPEQAQPGSRKLDGRTDVYSLGVTLYALLTGRLPFNEPDILDLLTAIAKRRPPPVREFNQVVSPELEAAVLRALEKAPEHRYPTAGAFAEEIDRLLREGRYAGKYGLAKHLFHRWWPRAAAGLALAVAVRYGAPHLVAAPHPAGAAEDRDALYVAASVALKSIEKDLLSGTPADLQARLSRDVVGRLDKLLEANPRHLPARVEKIRAAYVGGRPGVDSDLAAVAPEHRRDYRIPFLRALRALEASMGEPPLPAIEAPFPDWESPPTPFPPGVLADLSEAAETAADSLLAEERQRDAPAIRALSALAQSRWEEAAAALAEVMKVEPFPVVAKAWVRAAYLGGRFADVRASSAAFGKRESRGAGIALAAASSKSEEAFEAMLKECREDRQARVMLHAALAWRAVDAGRDPDAHVTAGLEEADREWRGVLLMARLRRLSLSGKDSEALYGEVKSCLGDAPSSWLGRRASVEQWIGLGTRHARLEAPRTALDAAVPLANALTKRAPSWTLPRLLRARALLRLDRPIDAYAELATLVDGPSPETPELVTAAAAWLQITEQRRRDGAPCADEAERCRKYARQALAVAPDHPEALNLAAAAELSRVEEGWTKGESSELLEQAMEKLDRALAAVPGFVDARVHRAAAHYLRGQLSSKPEGAASALADLDAVLAAAPALAPALYLRGVVHFSLGRFAQAAEDWKPLAVDGSAWNTPELRLWISKAEARKAGR